MTHEEGGNSFNNAKQIDTQANKFTIEMLDLPHAGDCTTLINFLNRNNISCAIELFDWAILNNWSDLMDWLKPVNFHLNFKESKNIRNLSACSAILMEKLKNFTHVSQILTLAMDPKLACNKYAQNIFKRDFYKAVEEFLVGEMHGIVCDYKGVKDILNTPGILENTNILDRVEERHHILFESRAKTLYPQKMENLMERLLRGDPWKDKCLHFKEAKEMFLRIPLFYKYCWKITPREVSKMELSVDELPHEDILFSFESVSPYNEMFDFWVRFGLRFKAITPRVQNLLLKYSKTIPFLFDHCAKFAQFVVRNDWINYVVSPTTGICRWKTVLKRCIETKSELQISWILRYIGVFHKSEKCLRQFRKWGATPNDFAQDDFKLLQEAAINNKHQVVKFLRHEFGLVSSPKSYRGKAKSISCSSKL